MAFPSLSTNPQVERFGQKAAFNPTIRSEAESGYVQTRPRFTRTPKKWHVFYSGLSLTDKTSLESHEVSVKFGSDLFSWTNPTDSVSHNVRYAAPIDFNLESGFDNSGNHTWSAEFDLEEV